MDIDETPVINVGAAAQMDNELQLSPDSELVTPIKSRKQFKVPAAKDGQKKPVTQMINPNLHLQKIKG